MIGHQAEYWEKRYRRGGDSGFGSVGPSREWKWSIIEGHAGQLDDVLDVGCGDLRFWEGKKCARYVGLDVSPSIVDRDRASHPTWDVLLVPSYEQVGFSARIVLCLDLLFHMMDDLDYLRTLQALASSTREWLFIHTWAVNPLAPRINDNYQRFREPRLMIRALESSGLEAVDSVQNPFNRFAKMYTFRKRSNP